MGAAGTRQGPHPLAAPLGEGVRGVLRPGCATCARAVAAVLALAVLARCAARTREATGGLQSLVDELSRDAPEAMRREHLRGSRPADRGRARGVAGARSEPCAS